MVTAKITMMHHVPPTIRKAPLKRDWMDETYKGHAYSCLPVATANIAGWELVLQQEVVVQYDGGTQPPKILSGAMCEFTRKDGHKYERQIADSTIPGVVSFPTAWTFNLPEHYGLWVTGSPNFFVEGATPMSATIPYWWPEDFNMNWKITKLNEPVVFPKGMPFMFFQIYDTRIMPSVEFEVQNAWDHESLIKERVDYRRFKEQRRVDEPWKWVGTIKTGLDHNGKRIGPRYERLPTLKEPTWE